MNPYTTFSQRLVTTLQTGLLAAGYSGVETRKGIWKPRDLLPFTRYLAFVAPPPANPVFESRIQTGRSVTETLRADVFLLVKNYDEELAVYGDTAPDLGVFQMLADTKVILRGTNLDGLVERTFREVEGGSNFASGASGGFDTGAHGWVHLIRLTYTAAMFPFCHP